MFLHIKTPHKSLTLKRLTTRNTIAAVICLLSLSFASATALADKTNDSNIHRDSKPHVKTKHKGPDILAIAAQLQLNKEQSQQLESAYNTHRKQYKESHQALRKKHKKEKREMAQAQKKEFSENLASFLDADEIRQLQDILKKNRPKHKRHHRKPPMVQE